jgi:hypothetical protein
MQGVRAKQAPGGRGARACRRRGVRGEAQVTGPAGVGAPDAAQLRPPFPAPCRVQGQIPAPGVHVRGRLDGAGEPCPAGRTASARCKTLCSATSTGGGSVLLLPSNSTTPPPEFHSCAGLMYILQAWSIPSALFISHICNTKL